MSDEKKCALSYLHLHDNKTHSCELALKKPANMGKVKIMGK
jgi:hypothetical protein